MRGALELLHDRGAHFVLCRGKKPIWKAWRRRRPPLEIVAGHGLELGIIPYSIGTSALDVDRGDVDRLVAETAPLVTLKSPRGYHCYYYDDEGRRNSRWNGYGCYGDVRSARGFLRLYEGGIERLSSALSLTLSDTVLFPTDVLQSGEYRPPCSPMPAGEFCPPCSPLSMNITGEPYAKTPDEMPALEAVQEGARNNSLFDYVRFRAYRQVTGDNYQVWEDWVLKEAREGNARFPKPLPQSEIRSVAHSVASWIWSRSSGGPIDRSASAQRRRGMKSGRARRRRTAERDVAIVEAVEAGQPMRAVAKAHGLSVSTVHHIVNRRRSS